MVQLTERYARALAPPPGAEPGIEPGAGPDAEPAPSPMPGYQRRDEADDVPVDVVQHRLTLSPGLISRAGR